MTGDAVEVLRLGDRTVAEYTWRPDLPASVAPRPYLHPVRTLGGTTVTELMPASHRHHLGVSVAVAEVDGANFWGGRTFVPGHGPAWLDNQGSQEHLRWLRRRPGQLRHTLHWNSIDGSTLFFERRDLSWWPAGPDAWALDFSFDLINMTDRELAIRSPAAHGRTGAGYGGFFWRAPSGECRVAASADGGTVHGQRARWLSVAGNGWTLVFLGADEATRGDRWFVRTRDYVGVGSSLAWDEPLLLAPHAELGRRIVTVIADGDLPPGRAAAYADEYSA
ncbi:PmoA family protein [Actinoplanes sp. NPDC026670]|uniref:DUF6807 domain-containing protein n=1 Tax=Actinoplanes sp. NPDC026670 TaxID=3154700 RepID=UPI0033C16D91